MRSEWPAPTFGQLIEQGVLEVGDGYRAKNDELGGNGLIFLRAGHVSDTHIDFAGAERFLYTGREKFGSKIARPGDVVVTTKGNSTGRVAFVSKEMPPFVYSPHLSYWRSRSYAVLLPGFLRAWSRCEEFSAQLEAMSRSTDMAPYLSLSDQRRLQIALPPIDVQAWIAGIGDSIEARISLLRQTNATLESLAQALFKSWFIDFDPVRARAEGREPEGMDAATAALFPAEFEESVLGLIPKGWHSGTLAALCGLGGGSIQTGPFGSQLHASDYSADGIPVVMPQDLDGRRISTLRVARVDTTHVDRLSRHKLAQGDIVFSRRGDVGRHAAVTAIEAGWLCGTGCLLVRPGPRWPSTAYVSQALGTPEATGWLQRHAVGATMPNLNTGILGALPILLPEQHALVAFEATVGPIESRISANIEQAKVLSHLRDSLLPRLISGKLRLPEARDQLEEALA